MTNTNDITKTTLAAFQKRVNTLAAERDEWQCTLFASANERLYELLAHVYSLYLDAKEGSGVDTEKYDWLKKEVDKRGIACCKNPTFIQLVTKLIFCDSDTDSRRVNSYARVLACAAQEDIGNSREIPDYIADRGGIEEIRSAMSKNTKTMKQRASEAAPFASAAETIAIVEADGLAQYATAAHGKFVVLLGVMNARGQVEIKHKVFGSDVDGDHLTSNTVINGALANLYSNETKKRKDAEKRKQNEDKATGVNNIKTDVNATADIEQAA